MLLLDQSDHRAGVRAQWKDDALCCTCAYQELYHTNRDLRQQEYVNPLSHVVVTLSPHYLYFVLLLLSTVSAVL